MTTNPAKRRWPGILLSLFVPGFGLVRAGHIGRAVAWFLLSIVLSTVLSLLFIWRSFPTWALVIAYGISLGLFILMLVDSFRPGRFTWRMGLIFVLVALTQASIPSPHAIIGRAFKMPSDGMYPTLRGPSHGTPPDYVYVNHLSYLFALPARGDLAVFKTAGISRIKGDPTFFTQRIVGLPGERIQIRDGHIFANERQLGPQDGIPDFTYTNPLPDDGPADRSGTYQVPADSYFMLGDNSPNSFDSRYWGYLPSANLYGTVSRIYYPLSRIGAPQ